MAKLCIESELNNIAPRFKKAIYRYKEVNRIFNSAKEARKYYNLSRCNYYYYSIDDSGNETVIRKFENARKAFLRYFGSR